MKQLRSVLNPAFLTILVLFLILSRQDAKAQRTFTVNGRVINVKDLNREINVILDSASIPGLSFAVIADNKVVFYNTYGYKEIGRTNTGGIKGKGKVDKETVFEACSLSKNFFSFAVNQLVDQGVLDLDVPLYQYLKNPRLEYDDRYKKITARMVLSHTSGLENWKGHNDWTKLELVNTPGEKFLYSGEGYMYLAKVIEVITKKSTDEYMHELVLDPLHLKNTFLYYSKDGQSPGNYALGHNVFLEPVPKQKNLSPHMASYINTTAYDFATMQIAYFGGKYLSRKRIEDIIGPDVVHHFHYPDHPDYPYNHWGPGIAVSWENQDTVVYQSGDNGEWKSFAWYSLTKKIGFAMFTNGEYGDQIIKVLDSLTTGQHTLFDIDHNIFGKERGTLYPSMRLKLLRVYNIEGYASALSYFNTIVSKKDSVISKRDFDESIDLFMSREPQFAAYIASEYENRYPSSQEAVILHGQAMVNKEDFAEAVNDFQKALKVDSARRGELNDLITRYAHKE